MQGSNVHLILCNGARLRLTGGLKLEGDITKLYLGTDNTLYYPSTTMSFRSGIIGLGSPLFRKFYHFLLFKFGDYEKKSYLWATILVNSKLYV